MRQLQYIVRTLEGTATLPKTADGYKALKILFFTVSFLNIINLNCKFTLIKTVNIIYELV